MSTKNAWCATVYFFAITLWLTWPLATRLATALSGSPDALLNAWALGWNFHVVPEAPLSLFDANIFAPRPDTLAYSEHLFGVAAIVWPVYVASNNLILAYNVAIFGSFVLCGVGMYLLVRELTDDESDGWAALAAGTVYCAAPYRFLHLFHVQLLSMQWFPFVLWCLARYLKTGGRGWLVGVVSFSLLQALSCNYYAVYLAFAVIVFGVVVVLAGRSLLSGRRVAELALGALAVFVVALPFLLPYQRNQERGFYRRYEDVVQFSAAPSDYLRPSAYNKAPHVKLLPPQERSEKALYPGMVALLCIAAGIYFGRTRDVRGRVFWIFAIVVAALAVVLSLGPETASGSALPYRFFYRHVPGFSGIRVPARMAVLALVGGCVLVGYGVRGILALADRRRRLTAAGLLGLMLFDYQTYTLERALPEAPSIPPIYRELAKAVEDGAVLTLPIHEGEEIIEESLYMYYSTVHWKPLVNGFSGWWPNDYWELVGRLRHFPTSRILRFMLERAPVRYVVIHYDRIPQPRRRQLEGAMERYRERMPVLVRIGDDVVYEVVDGS